nr:uncharacterized protein LOC106680395 [Halyomorpha halys]
MIIGHLNAKIGKEVAFRPTIGRESGHDYCNDNGHRIINFAMEKGLVISSTKFPHKETWISPDGLTRNQIDHVLIEVRHASDIRKVRSFRGVDCDTDHHMVKVWYRQMLAMRRCTTLDRVHTYNLEKLLESEVAEGLKNKIRERLRENNIVHNTNINDRWKILKNVVKESASKELDGAEEVEAPEKGKIIEIIKSLRNHKLPGLDERTPEMMKYGGSDLWEAICDLIWEIWTEEKMPEDWTRAVICPIHKKGDKLTCDNYRGIALLSTTYKILAVLLHKRVSDFTENIIGEYQGGFRPGRLTVDQIFTLRQAMEKCYEYNIDLHLLFVDFKQAYDSVDRKDF